MNRLQNGERLPAIELDAVGGNRLVLPEDLRGFFGVVLAYRGSWCPYCNAQLASYQRRLPMLTEAGIKVVAISADDEEHAQSTVAQHHLTYPRWIRRGPVENVSTARRIYEQVAGLT